MTVHQQLAHYWAEWNGQRGTANQLARIMRQLDVPTLARMLRARGFILPASVTAVLPAEEV